MDDDSLVALVFRCFRCCFCCCGRSSTPFAVLVAHAEDPYGRVRGREARTLVVVEFVQNEVKSRLSVFFFSPSSDLLYVVGKNLQKKGNLLTLTISPSRRSLSNSAML